MQRTNPEIFNKNMASLSLRYPDIAQKVSNTSIMNYTLFIHDKTAPNIQHNIIKRPWYEGRIDQYLESQWENIDLESIKFPIFLGVGLAYEVNYFLQKYGPKNLVQSVIIIERDVELFAAALNVIDLTPIINNEKVKLFVGIPAGKAHIEFLEFFRNNMQFLLYCGTTGFIYTKMAYEIAGDYYKYVQAKLIDSMWNAVQQYGNDPDDSLIGLENMLDNIKQIIYNPGINMLYDKFKNKPAVIVATGPSLKKNMQLLKEIQNKALIISVDASFKFLLKNGIKPHMVTSLEREHAVQEFFDNHDPEEVKDIYMTACPVLFNHVYEAYCGPKIIVYRQFDHFKWLKLDKGMMNIRLSSSNMAFKIADNLGCYPITMIGQDLAYGDDGETHATKVPFSSEGEGEFEVQGNVKDKVKTNSGWYSFLTAYESDILEYLNKGGKAINATEGGAYIKGTEVQTFREVIDKYIKDDINPLEIIKENLKSFSNESSLEDMQDLFDKTEENIIEILKLCETALNEHTKHIEEIKDLDNKKDDGKIKEIFNKIVSYRNKITTDYHETYQLFLMHVVQSTHIAFEIKSVMKNKTLKELAMNYDEWYENVFNITKICLDSLLKAKKKLYK